MLANYGYIGLLLIVAIIVPISFLLLPLLLSYLRIRPKKPDEVKSSTYECGMQTVGESWVQFNFRYYFFALFFVVFDIGAIFLYPWAIAFRKLRLFGFVEMLIFILILVVGLVYAWRKGVLEWK